MSFWAMYQGSGEGCDYTIGCNTRHERLKATTLEDAKAEALLRYEYEGGVDTDRIASITVLEVATEHDLDGDLIALKGRLMEERTQAERAEKRAKLEQLKRELGE
ncbi:MAG TPA: hypothetical protein VFB99_10400 [Vicinamibacterales bacterium]|nr:hypothetical protein [Vicinamibacterales bacterium]